MGLLKSVFFTEFLSTLTGVNSLNAIPLSFISMNNQECKVRPQVVHVNGDDPAFFFPLVLKRVNELMCQELMKQDAYGMKRVSIKVDLTVVFVIINNVQMMINTGVNAKN